MWSRSTNASDDLVYGLTTDIDQAGNIIIGGHFSGYSVTFGNTTLNNSNGYTYGKMFVVKYDNNGNLLWAKTPSISSYSCSTLGTVTDKNNNIYITGHFQDNTFTFSGMSLSNANPGIQDVFLYKLDSNGNSLWAKMLGGTSHDVGTAISLDKNSNVYIAGNFKSSVILSGSNLIMNSNNNDTKDIFLAKFDTNGNYLWSKSFGGNSDDEATSLTNDQSGNIYLSGNYKSTSFNIGSNNFAKSSNTNTCLYLTKLDSLGNIKWAKSTTTNTSNSSINGIASDNYGQIYSIGNFDGSTLELANSTLQNSANGLGEAFMTKYDSLGNVLYAKSFIGFGNDFGKTIDKDIMGNIFLSGHFAGNYILTDNNFTSNNYNGTNDIYIMRFFEQNPALGITTGIMSQKHDVRLFPNPFKNEFEIFADIESFENLQVNLFSSTGAKVNASYQVFNNKIRVQTTNLNAGPYILKINYNGELIASKVIISAN